jgi:transcriptional regulator with XRE-family HTH domain
MQRAGRASVSVDVNAIRALREEGLSQRDIADRLGVNASTVSRALAADLDRQAERAVDRLVESLGELDADRLARVEALRTLAAKLDWARQAGTGSAAMAAASIAREFRSLLDELRPGQTERWDAITRLLSGADE